MGGANKKLARPKEEGAEQRAKKLDYKVGYKRPPTHSRFQPGQSGKAVATSALSCVRHDKEIHDAER